MAYSLMRLNPEGTQAIARALEEPRGRSKFLEDLSSFLNSVGPSVAGQDLAFCTAAELNAAAIFEQVPIAELADVLSSAKDPSVIAFTMGLPSSLRSQISEFQQGKSEKRGSPKSGTLAELPAKSRPRKVAGQLKLQVPAGSATPSLPIGPALGQRGINIIEFCKAFNAQTQLMAKGAPVPVVITYYQDKSFTFVMKTPPVSYFLKKAAKMRNTSKGHPNGSPSRNITKDQVSAIAKEKMKYFHGDTLEEAINSVKKQANMLGITIDE